MCVTLVGVPASWPSSAVTRMPAAESGTDAGDRRGLEWGCLQGKSIFLPCLGKFGIRLWK